MGDDFRKQGGKKRKCDFEERCTKLQKTRDFDSPCVIEQHVIARTLTVEEWSEVVDTVEMYSDEPDVLKRFDRIQLYLRSTLRMIGKYLRWEHALQLYKLCGPLEEHAWRFQHMLCSKVMDTWNILPSDMSVGHQRYASVRPRFVLNIATPRLNLLF